MQITTDDDVYRVDAVWLGPPRATFPWRARYSSYGVGLLVMIAVMFVQRRLGIDLGFFSVAWALLITVVVARFVGRRINEDRPLLEWLTLFVHELRGPRRVERGVGSALDASRVRVRRDRPRPTREAPAVALPRRAGAPAPSDQRVITPRVRRAGEAPSVPTPPSGLGVVTPGLDEGPPAHGVRGERPRRRARPRADSGFGPPSSATVGEPGDDEDGPAALPPAAPRPDPAMAAWTTPPAREREPVRVRAQRVDSRAPVPAAPRPRGGAPAASGADVSRPVQPRTDRPRRPDAGPRRFGPGASGAGSPTAAPRRGGSPVADDATSEPRSGVPAHSMPSAPQERISPSERDPAASGTGRGAAAPLREDPADDVPGSFGPGSRRAPRSRPDDTDPREGDGAAPQSPP